MENLSAGVHTGLDSATINKLNESNVETVLDFLNCESKQIEKITALTLMEILEIKKELLKKFSRPINAHNFYRHILDFLAIIPSGISSLDNLLEGGLYCGNIYEICGLPAAGKTFFCLTLLKNIAPNQNKQIIYLDTKYDFSGVKLKQMMSFLNKEELTEAMSRILVARIITKQDFLKALFELKEDVQSGKVIKLLIIDSLAPLSFNSSDQTENCAFLNYSANILRYLAKEHNVIIIVTNLMTVWNDGDFKNKDVMKDKICCGSYWYGVPNVRIVLKKEKDTCKMTLAKTIKFIPEIDFCVVKFTGEGFT